MTSNTVNALPHIVKSMRVAKDYPKCSTKSNSKGLGAPWKDVIVQLDQAASHHAKNIVKKEDASVKDRAAAGHYKEKE